MGADTDVVSYTLPFVPGVVPGASAVISSLGSYVVVQVDGFAEGLELPVEVATHIYAAS